MTIKHTKPGRSTSKAKMTVDRDYTSQSRARQVRWFVLIVSLFSFSLNSCNKFLEVDPPKKQLISSSVFSDDKSAQAALNGIYGSLINSGFASGDNNSITFIGGFSADELINYNQTYYGEFYENNVRVNSQILESLWQGIYFEVYYANSILEGLSNNLGVSNDVKLQLEGEAKFIRAFCYFYLINLFGDVPLHLTTEYHLNSVRARTPISDIFEQIKRDLQAARTLLRDDYSVSNGERVRPNSAAASALLARVYLYNGEWSKAEIEATSIIDNSALYWLEPDLNNVFLANSNEAIWQLMPVTFDRNTNEGFSFILNDDPTVTQYQSLSSEMLSAFEVDDDRRATWTDSFTIGVDTWYYPIKYKIKEGGPLSEYSMVLRLAEQYLIRAEARTQQNNFLGAKEDINSIRSRAGLEDTPASDRASLLLAIEHERQVELFTEWGHRWLDLKRTNRADEMLRVIKSPNWQQTDALYPIPQKERSGNSHISQNDGY